MNYKIRTAAIEDVEAISRIHVDAWHAAYQGKMPLGLIQSYDIGRRQTLWRKIISGNLAEVLVADDGSGLLGFLCFGQPKALKNTSDYDLSSLYLHPDKIGAGIGRALYQECESRLLARHARQVTLWALDSNQTALAFYRKLGFVPTGATNKERAGEVVLNDIELVKSLIRQ